MARRTRTAILLASVSLGAGFQVTAASEFNTFGYAPEAFSTINTSRPDIIIELGASGGMAPVYEGASTYGAKFAPIIGVERINIPGIIDIGGNPTTGGFKFAPSIDVIGERKSADHEALQGLDDVAATYAVGAKVGYEFVFNDVLKAQVYGTARYAFGGAEGLVGEAGLDVTAKLTPELEIVGGSSVHFASDDYMKKYFGVSSAESAATGGRLAAYDPSGGAKSVELKLGAKYEFIPDTFLNLNASYTRLLGDAEASPIVQAGDANQFAFSLGLSRRFTVSY